MYINIENAIFKIFSTKYRKRCLNTHLPQEKFYLKEFKPFMPKSGFFEHLNENPIN